MIETLAAIATALAIILLTVLSKKHIAAPLIAATLLCSIAFIYVGFSLKDNSVSSIILESLIAVAFFSMAIIGYAKHHYLIAYGIVLHGVWDIAHHGAVFIRTDIPHYWPAYCLITDIIIGIYYFLVFRIHTRAYIS